MSTLGTHIIRQQYLDISFEGTEQEGMALQQQMTGVCTHQLIPAMEAILDRLAPAGSHVYIDQLDIDLGEMEWDEVSTAIKPAFLENLEKAIQQKLADHQHTHTIVNGDPAQEGIRILDQYLADFEVFMYFLKHGRIPWNAVSLTIPNPLNPTELKRLSETLRSHPAARVRLALQDKMAHWEQILGTFSDATAMEIKYVMGLFQAEAHQIFRQKIVEGVLELWANGAATVQRNAVFTKAIQLLHSDKNAKAVAFSKVLATNTIKLPVEWAPLAVLPMDATIQNVAYTDDSLAIYINNAGLVLLHPFLPQLFEGTGIAKDGQIIDPERAVQLLHYLATGHKTTPEEELVLPKILCGIPVEMPIDLQPCLRTKDIEEADALLLAAIRHWSVLQNTSPDGLRGTFLLRPGKLTSTPDGAWTLQVEYQSVDILLAQLPWGISMIQSAWMLNMLMVNWEG
jgi:Contractile injection system tape measure protein